MVKKKGNKAVDRDTVTFIFFRTQIFLAIFIYPVLKKARDIFFSLEMTVSFHISFSILNFVCMSINLMTDAEQLLYRLLSLFLNIFLIEKVL